MALVTSAAASLKNTWGFSPQSIPGLQLWLDAADTTSITGTSTVTAWRDKSGTARTVSFTGTNTYTSSPASVNTNGSTAFFQADADFRKSTVPNGSLFLVYKWNNSTAGTNQCLWGTDRGGGNNRGQVFTFPANTSIQYGLTINFSAPSFAIVSGINNGNLLIYNANYSLGVVNGTFVNVNGSLSTSLATEGAANPQTSQSAISFGCVDDTGRLPSAVSFSEIILFNTALTTSERQQVEGYLAAKWGLGMNLPTTHPYSSVIPILPTQISGLQLWLDAADASTVTGTSPVTGWADKSGNNYNLIVGSGTTTYTPYGANPSIKLNSSYMYVNKAVNLTQYTMFIAALSQTAVNNQPVFAVKPNGNIASYNGTDGFAFYIDSTVPQLRFYASPNLTNTTTAVSISQPPVIASYTSTSTSVAYSWINGTAGVSNVTGGVTRLSTGQGFAIGAEWSGSAYGNPISIANIYEIIVFNTVLTTTQRQQVEQYLGRKWGIGVTNTTVAPGRYLIPFNRPFYPTDIPGCSLWLDGADRSSMTFSSGSSVSSWNDKSGNGYNFTNNGGSTNPTADPTMGLLFTTVRSFANSSVPIPSNYTLFLVGNLTSIPSSYGRMINMNTTTDGFGFLGTFNNSFNFATFTGSGGGTWYDTNANTPTNTVASSPNLSIMAMTISGTSLTPFFNGTILNSKTNSGSTSSTTGMCLNGISFAGQGVNAHFAEVFLFNSPLSTSQRQQVEQYLAWKWGLVANLPPATSHLGKLLPAFSTNFTPKSLTGLRLWLDAADLSTIIFQSGTNMSQWTDKSGNGNHGLGRSGNGTSISTTGGPNYVSSTNGITFDTNQFFITSLTINTQTHCLIAVHNPTIINGNYAGNTRVFSFQNIGTLVVFPYMDGTTARGYIGSAPGAPAYNNSTLKENSVAGQKNIIVANIAATSQLIFKNGTLQNSGTNSIGGATSDSLSIGKEYRSSFNDAYEGYQGTIHEMFVFNTTLTTQQQQQVEGYLAWKWGLQSSLPSTHAYAKFSP